MVGSFPSHITSHSHHISLKSFLNDAAEYYKNTKKRTNLLRMNKLSDALRLREMIKLSRIKQIIFF